MNIIFSICCAYPTPLNKTGLSVAAPTMVGAFSRFAGSATIRLCWRHKGWLVNNNVARHLSRPGWSHFVLPSEWIQVCLPLRGQTRRSCDGRWLPSSPHRPQCRTRCRAPSEGHLCNRETALMQDEDASSLSVCQKNQQVKTDWPMSELAATRTFPPPSMKEVIVSTLMFPPKSTREQTKTFGNLFLKTVVKKISPIICIKDGVNEMYPQLKAQRWLSGHTGTGHIWWGRVKGHQLS